LIALEAYVIRNKSVDRNREVFATTPREGDCPLLTIHDPGRLQLTVTRQRDLDGSCTRERVAHPRSPITSKPNTRREGENQRIGKEDVFAVQVLDDVPNVSPYLGSLIPEEFASFIARHTRNVRHLEEFLSGESE